MDPRSLLRSLPETARSLLPAELRDFHSTARWVIVQLYYGNRDIHYEAWHRAKQRTIEIELHFESDDLTNARLLGAFRAHERAIRRVLPNARLEEWDKGWARIWEPIEAETLDDALRRHVADQMARYISTLEPILRDELPADVAWSLAPARRSRRTRSKVRS